MTEPITDFIAADIRKSETEYCRVTLGEFKGRPTIDVRLYYDAGDAWRPSKSGVTLAARHLVTLKAGIDAACDEARRRGVLDGDGQDPAGRAA
jgi:hypothetical protein